MMRLALVANSRLKGASSGKKAIISETTTAPALAVDKCPLVNVIRALIRATWAGTAPTLALSAERPYRL
eukprot:2377836-Amphidinium_carterae.1